MKIHLAIGRHARRTAAVASLIYFSLLLLLIVWHLATGTRAMPDGFAPGLAVSLYAALGGFYCSGWHDIARLLLVGYVGWLEYFLLGLTAGTVLDFACGRVPAPTSKLMIPGAAQISRQLELPRLSLGSTVRRLVGVLCGFALLTFSAHHLYQIVLTNIEDMPVQVVLYAQGPYFRPCFLLGQLFQFFEGLVVAIVGLTLIALPKKPILFLRRFGLDVNSVVSRVIRKKLGGRFRFVTLDDSRFPPLAIPALQRWAFRLGPLIISVAVIASAVYFGTYYGSHPGSNFAQGELARQIHFALDYWVAVLAGLMFFAWTHSLLVRRRAHKTIRTPLAMEKLLHEVELLGSLLLRLRVLAPHAMVANVSDELWRQCVSDIAARVPIILFDLSEPTSNLLWEIEHAQQAGLHGVFIAEAQRFEGWHGRLTESEPDGPANRVAQLVGDRAVLLYDCQQKFGGELFGANLRKSLLSALQAECMWRLRKRLPMMGRVWHNSMAAAKYGFALLISLLAGALLGVLVFMTPDF